MLTWPFSRVFSRWLFVLFTSSVTKWLLVNHQEKCRPVLLFFLIENISLVPLCAQTLAQIAQPAALFYISTCEAPTALAHSSLCSAKCCFEINIWRHPPSTPLSPSAWWCNNRGGLLLPSYRGKVEITLSQGLTVSVTKAPRTVQVPFSSFVIHYKISGTPNHVKTKLFLFYFKSSTLITVFYVITMGT